MTTKNVLVTGASKGIGRSIAETLINSGYNVYATARNEAQLLSLNAKGYFVCELTSKTDLIKLAEFIEANNIDILVNNAGEYIYSPIEKVEYEQIEEIMNTNLLAPIFLIKSAMKNMKAKNWGRIVNIGSISGVMGEAFACLYSSSKSGLIGLSKALALELAQDNITVNVINPGWVDTELGKGSISDSDFDESEIVECIPQKRFVEPIEVANLVKYLISEEAKGITGQSINLCAGLSVGF